jgi:hypothetical protein
MFLGFLFPKSQKESWLQRLLKQFWKSTLKNPPQHMIYFIKDPLFLDIKLSLGEGLKRINSYKELCSIRIIYVYLSFRASCLIIYKEDAKFRLINLLRSREHKLWLIVELAYEKELKRRLRQEFPKVTNCSQAVRYLSRVIISSKLNK